LLAELLQVLFIMPPNMGPGMLPHCGMKKGGWGYIMLGGIIPPMLPLLPMLHPMFGIIEGQGMPEFIICMPIMLFCGPDGLQPVVSDVGIMPGPIPMKFGMVVLAPPGTELPACCAC
jgi:hypothetical protein